MENKKILLRDVMRQSKTIRQVDIDGLFTLNILPWNAVQMEALQDCIAKITEGIRDARRKIKESGSLIKNEKDSDNLDNLFEILLTLAEKKDLAQDIFNLIYITLERGNDKIKVLYNGDTTVIDFFTKEEMREELNFLHHKEILSAILELNFKINPLAQTEEEEKPEKKTKKK